MSKMLEAYRRKRVGKTVVATNGQKMTITEYNGSNDITVKFEDNTEVKHKAYKQFIKGEIRNPNVAVHTYAKQTERKTENRVGETVTNTNGLRMTIIGYENAHNVDVRFENGIIVLKKNYFHFKNGQIKMPVFSQMESASKILLIALMMTGIISANMMIGLKKKSYL